MVSYDFESTVSIAQELVRLHNEGVTLTTPVLKKNHRPLYNAISEGENHIGLVAAREMAAEILEKEGEVDAATKIRTYSRRSLSKDAIVERLIDLHKDGVRLTGPNLREADSSVARHIGKNGYFTSLMDAREAAAKRLEKEGDYESAEQIRTYNANWNSRGDWSKPKLIAALGDAYQNGASLTVNGLLGYDSRLFWAIDSKDHIGSLVKARELLATKLETEGKYDDAAAVREYNSRECMRKGRDWTEQMVIDELIELHASGEALTSRNINKKDYPLYYIIYSRRFFQSIFEVREATAAYLEKVGDTRNATEIRMYNERAKQKKANPRSVEYLTTLETEKTYSASEIPFDLFKGELSGREIFELLRSSEDWLTSAQLSKRLHISRTHISTDLKYEYGDYIIRYRDGSRGQNFYHITIVDKYQRQKPKVVHPNSIEQIASEMNIGQWRVRRLIPILELNAIDGEEGVTILPVADIATVQEVVDRENRIVQNILGVIKPGQYYSFMDFEAMAVPTAGLYTRVRKGEIPFIVDGRRRLVKGTDALDYLKANIDSLILSPRIRLLTHFNEGIYTIQDFMWAMGVPKYKVAYRLNKLLEENPNACFRVRKSDRWSRIIATEEVFPYLRGWSTRHELHLLDVIGGVRESPSRREVTQTMLTLEERFLSQARIQVSQQSLAFEALNLIKAFEAESVPVSDSALTRKAIRLVYRYMDMNDYSFLELDRKYDVDEVHGFVRDLKFLDQVGKSRSKLEHILCHSNSGLIYRVLRDKGINPDMTMRSANTAFDVGQDALMRAVRSYDTSRGFKFPSLAYVAIRRALQNELRPRKQKITSLDRTIDDKGTEIVDLQEDDSAVAPYKPLTDKQLTEEISQMLENLDEREKDIVIRNIGLFGRKKQTMREIAKDYKITHQRVQQIAAGAFEKLSRNPKAKALRDAYFMDV